MATTRRLKLRRRFASARWKNIRAGKRPVTGRRLRTISAIALARLGVRECNPARLEQAVAAYHAALEEQTRERVPLEWAQTQNSLGNALQVLGERESGTARLEEAVAAYRAALEECTRERVPLDWAATQNNLGSALESAWRAGERDSAARGGGRGLSRGAGGMDTRAGSAPMGGDADGSRHALQRLGEREGGTARLEEAVAACRAALEECTRERVPLQWAATQAGLGNALSALGDRESGTARLEEAVVAYRAALEELTRERVPLQWARAQNNLGTALELSASGRAGRRGSSKRSRPIAQRFRNEHASGFRSSGRRHRTILAMRSGARRAREPDRAARGGGRSLSCGARGIHARAGSPRLGGELRRAGIAMMLIADRTADGMLAETAVRQIEAAYETRATAATRLGRQASRRNYPRRGRSATGSRASEAAPTDGLGQVRRPPRAPRAWRRRFPTPSAPLAPG